MTSQSTTTLRIDELAAADPRYATDAYHFVFEVLDFVLDRSAARRGERVSNERHVSVGQLLDGLREYALDQWGPLARIVLERWGLRRTEDFGEIVFILVENRLLNKQDEDRITDFRNGFNFREAFDRAWRIAPKPAP
ncbi:MAG TPA: Minf_1886 family protein [Planctomycetota bacterium]|jgi:uncharacterized repeat protein (TIGR04138 family)|nr:Minf_1886 family protein [Gaiellaceae bacterium]HVQ27515.1 Minf_1886 family protein [Planctomycetota bacterium]